MTEMKDAGVRAQRGLLVRHNAERLRPARWRGGRPSEWTRCRRSGGARAHAAVDLYMPDGTPVLALAHGTVAREPYAFYRDTWALDIDHGAFLESSDHPLGGMILTKRNVGSN